MRDVWVKSEKTRFKLTSHTSLAALYVSITHRGVNKGLYLARFSGPPGCRGCDWSAVA